MKLSSSPFEFDVGHWLAVLEAESLLRTRPTEVLLGPGIAGPGELMTIETIREELSIGTEVEGIATDVFVFAIGEPQRRDVTKIGGLPYRPRGLRWPTARDGSPLTFLGQCDFRDSPPGSVAPLDDLLLIFGKENYPGEDEDVELEWYPSGISDLVVHEEVPKTNWNFLPCYGIRHRTIDYWFEAIPRFQAAGYSDCYKLTVLHGTKIGGIPAFNNPEYFDRTGFLGSLASVEPLFECSYPFINRREPLRMRDILPERIRQRREWAMAKELLPMPERLKDDSLPFGFDVGFFQWAASGRLNLFLLPGGGVAWKFEHR